MDIWNNEKRSEVMSKIRSKNTKPELTLRKALFKRGLRYRVNVSSLPGKPDIVMPKYKTVIFLHGCFWHRHEGCKYAYTPKTNTEFWVNKITSNSLRDKKNVQKLTALGWNIITVWECEIRHEYKHDITPLIDRITAILLENEPSEYSGDVDPPNCPKGIQAIPKKMSIKLYEQKGDEIMMVAEDVFEYQRTTKQ